MEAAIQHWARWVDALENFRASCHRRFTRVLAPALSLEAAEKDMTPFFKTVNIILINHHCTLLSSDGPAVFFDYYSDGCEELAEMVRVNTAKGGKLQHLDLSKNNLDADSKSKLRDAVQGRSGFDLDLVTQSVS